MTVGLEHSMMKTSVVPKGHIPKLLGTIDYSWMYDCELSTDVLLIPDDGEGIKAHKVILAAFSPFLKECLLEEAEYHCDKMLQLHLPDYSNAAIRDFVKVLYGCEEDDERAMACLEEVESLWIQDVPIKPLEEDGRTKAARGKRAAYRKRVRRTSSYDPDWKLEKHKKRQEAVALAASEIVDVKSLNQPLLQTNKELFQKVHCSTHKLFLNIAAEFPNKFQERVSKVSIFFVQEQKFSHKKTKDNEDAHEFIHMEDIL
eukprot:snap_masked-scaffold1541_size36691-processed-gene-0.3 protein:Tk04154 transcript:snap_masked-scaffold1541_size36691-processed-gene-0.3-mRNA-1 annotation:"hypothetical protein AMTR_s00077p00025220"